MKRKILLGFLIFLVLYAGWLVFQILTFKTAPAPQPGQSFPGEVIGAYHIHSTLSDGKKSPEKIAEIAAANGLRFIILTDHGRPNFESLAVRGWKKGILVLAGSELSVNRGHLAAFGFSPPEHMFSHDAGEAASQIARLNGVSIVAHPFSRVSWSWGRLFLYSGIEIMNAYSASQKDWVRSLPYLPAALLKPDFLMVKMLDKPTLNIKRWDELLRRRTVYGYFAEDAHFYYGPLFRLFRLHVLLKDPLPKDFDIASRRIFDALKNGRFFNVVDAAASGGGFRFTAVRGKEKWEMGRSLRFSPGLVLHVQAAFAAKKCIHLLRNGEMISESRGDSLQLRAPSPGVYRVEVYLRGRTPLGKDIPWIVSNPIFLR